MDLQKFIKKEGRSLPVFLLIDVSGSMHGEKIGTVNTALKEMIESFMRIENPKGVIELCILTFGSDRVEVIKNLSRPDENDVYELRASGNTPLGMVLDRVTDMIEDYDVVPSTSYTPTIVLISDGNPTDYDADGKTVGEICQWEKMKRVHTESRTSKATRLAMGIGSDMNANILKAFVNDDKIPIILAKDNETISKFFEWVTMSVSVRSVSANPQKAQMVDYREYVDEDVRL